MGLAYLSDVRLVTDRYREHGVSRGDSGTIIEVYDDGGYEVEFSRPDGTTIAWFSVEPEDIEPEVAAEVAAEVGSSSGPTARS